MKRLKVDVCVSMLLLVGFVGTELASGYRPLDLHLLILNPKRFLGWRISVKGTYQPITATPALVNGWLAPVQNSPVRMRVIGPVFDWAPPTDTRVVFWGELKEEPGGGPYLDFFNGKKYGDKTRKPTITPDLSTSTKVVVTGRLRQVGTPIPQWELFTEDHKSILLLAFPPAGFEPVAGTLVRVEGIAGGRALPPAIGAIRVKNLQVLPGPGPSPFGG